MRVQDNILEEWKKDKTLIFILYKECGVTNKLKGIILDFDQHTLSISSFKNFIILNRKQILKIKGEKSGN